MNRLLALALCALAVLPACKIVFDDDTVVEISDGPEGDDARNADRLAATFESELLPLVSARALDVAALRAALSGGLDAAGDAHANRGAGRGAAWIFALRDTGTVVEATLDSSARTADLDVDGDGAADVRLQLGPVIRGTALRDAAPFYRFDDFRDQIEFAKLARALNDRVKPDLAAVTQIAPGDRVAFTGVVPLKSPTEQLVVTPTAVEVVP
jgi:predicted lipoprotein